MGFFLCGMAEEPFCFSLKYSCASRTSVRCRWRIFDGNLVEGAAEDGQRADVGGMTVALDDLRGDGRRLEAEARADALFVLRLEVAEGADGAGKLADAHVFGGCLEAGKVALHLGVPVQQLETEGRRLGVDAVSAADGGRVLELDGTTLEHREQSLDPCSNELPTPL